MRSLVVMLFAVLPSGCVTYDRHVNLDPVTGTAPVNAPAGKTITVSVEDRRAEDLSGVVGHTKNGFGMKMASVLADNKDPKSWVTECIVLDLKRAGFEARSVGDSEIQVHVDLLVCYAQAYWNYGGEVAADVVVSRGGVVLLPKTHFSGEATYGMNWGATEASYHAVLHDAMTKLLDDVTPAIARAITSGPSQ